jgi:asparagine synthase (glutamine-hydrolysing)
VSGGEQIVCDWGRWLIEACWGRYVAVYRDPGGNSWRVLRDPSGTMPCLMTTFEGLTLVFSHPGDAVRLGALEPSINWRHIAAHVSYPQLSGYETGLNGVSEICAGECFSWTRGSTSRSFLWHPARFARAEAAVKEHGHWSDEVHSTVTKCVHSWASRHRSILHRLSGGLDSSVVLSCLCSAPNRPTLTAINCFSHDTVGDERAYARAAAVHARCPLVELGIAPEIDLRRILTVERSARPGHYFTALQTAPLESRLARELQATAIFGGGWGDQLFYRTRTDASAMDYIAAHGFSGEWLTVVRDAAQFSRSTVWRVLRNLLWPRRWDPFPKQPAEDTYVNPEMYKPSLNSEDLLHPWFKEAADLPIGKLQHLLLLSAPGEFHRAFSKDEDPEPIEPLRSQPLMELCLGIPTYVMTRGAGDRLLVRAAFERDLPALVVRRLSKGFVDAGFQAVVRHNARFVRELLLDGMLVKQGILNRRKLEQSLSDGFLCGGPPQSELFAHVCTEAWLNVWHAV